MELERKEKEGGRGTGRYYCPCWLRRLGDSCGTHRVHLRGFTKEAEGYREMTQHGGPHG